MGRGWACSPAQASTSNVCGASASAAAQRSSRRLRSSGRTLRGGAFTQPPHQHHQHRRAVTTEAKPIRKQAELAMVAPENRQEVAVILDLAEQAAKGWSFTWSRFVTPPVAADALAALAQVQCGVVWCRVMWGWVDVCGCKVSWLQLLQCCCCGSDLSEEPPSLPFLSPHLNPHPPPPPQLADVSAIAWGGYPQAERCRCALERQRKHYP